MGKVIHWELCKKLKFEHTNKWYVHNPKSVLDNETHKSLNLGQTTRSYNNQQKKKRTCRIMDFDTTERKWKNLKRGTNTSTLLGNWKSCRMKITIIPIVINPLGTVTKGFVQELENLEIRERVETIQTTAFHIDSNMGPLQVLPLCVRVDLVVIVIKEVLHPSQSSRTGTQASDTV